MCSVTNSVKPRSLRQSNRVTPSILELKWTHLPNCPPCVCCMEKTLSQRTAEFGTQVGLSPLLILSISSPRSLVCIAPPIVVALPPPFSPEEAFPTSMSMIGPSQNSVLKLSSEPLRMTESRSGGSGAGMVLWGNGWSGSWKIGMMGGGWRW